jgi:hypothetical protein
VVTPYQPWVYIRLDSLQIGFVFAASEAAIHFPNPLSQLNLGAFQTSHKLGLFVQVGMISFEF